MIGKKIIYMIEIHVDKLTRVNSLKKRFLDDFYSLVFFIPPNLSFLYIYLLRKNSNKSLAIFP